MNINTAFRYALEFSIIIPAAVFAVLPVMDNLKFHSFRAYGIAGVVMLILIASGSYLCSYHFPKTRSVFIPVAAVLFLMYFFCVDAGLNKKLFCFLNASMLCEFCTMYATYLMASAELGNESGAFTIITGLVCLGLSVITGLVFFRTLTVKIPALLKEDRIKDIWDYMFLFPLVMTLLMYWMTPYSPKVVMTGRVRPIGLVLCIIIPVVIFLLWHIFWWITARLTESAKLQQENTFLQMESKRYNELKSYMNAEKTLRHDFRQHILVIAHYAYSNKLDELCEYLKQFTDNTSSGYTGYCNNNAVDAVASHYDRIASGLGINIAWRLDIPSVLPMREADYCAVMGNLLENSINAVKPLPEDKRTIRVMSSMLSDIMLGISIDNPYSGNISFGRNGLPVSSLEGHGTGLISVSNITERYGGSMNINTGNNTFSVDIILYCTK